MEIGDLRGAVERLDAGSPADMALLWSGKDIPTEVRIDENDPSSPIWSDNFSSQEAEVLRHLGIAFALEDTQAGRLLVDRQLNYPDDDPLAPIVRGWWEIVSNRFVRAARGRVELLAEGAYTESVLRSFELATLLENPTITAVNGLDRALLSSSAGQAFALLRRWDVERSRRYAEFVDATPDATDHERASARDDARESQLWYEQDFYESLGPNRELPPLPAAVASAVDLPRQAGAWKYSSRWRQFVRESQGGGS